MVYCNILNLIGFIVEVFLSHSFLILQVVGDGVQAVSDEMADYNDLIDIEAFLVEDTNMPSA